MKSMKYLSISAILALGACGLNDPYEIPRSDGKIYRAQMTVPGRGIVNLDHETLHGCQVNRSFNIRHTPGAEFYKDCFPADPDS